MARARKSTKAAGELGPAGASEGVPTPDAAPPATGAPALPATLSVRDGVAWLVFDAPGKRVNTLSQALLGWFDEQLTGLASEPLRGLVLRSGKPDTFVAGADVEEIAQLSDGSAAGRAAARELLRRGHALFSRVAELPFPTVAAIHGACLGGGLELALCCDWRLASEHEKTRLGLPEVELGIIPGLGGTQRLPRLIGVAAALELILTARQVPASRARKLGLVDETCAPAILGRVAVALLARGKRGRPRPRGGWGGRLGDFVARSPLGGRLVYDRARARTLRKTSGHYPAPLRAIEVVEKGLRLPLPQALAVESEAFVDLVSSDTARSLIGIFLMKGGVDGKAAQLARGARPVPRVGVLGAGLMGAGIAQSIAHRGTPVVIKDRDLAALARGMKYCADREAELVARRRQSDVDRKQALARIHPTLEYESLHHLDFVVEAVFEDLEVKRQVLREVETATPAGAIFASNTSAIPIAELAAASARPQQVVGMHFFSPVHRMPLVEVIRHPGTAPEVVATTVAVGRAMGKTVIVVGDGPGFFTSRVLGPFLNEAVWCLLGGATIEEVDAALKAWGWPAGGLSLLDEVGLDVATHAGEVLLARLGDRLDPPLAFAKMLADGRQGRKAGQGFYRYDGEAKRTGAGRGHDGGKRPDPAVYGLLGWSPRPLPAAEIAERCWLQMLNEVARTMEEGILTNPDAIDIGVIFGLGFPPFRGGILREADRVGLEEIVRRLDGYAARHGKRLEPAPLLRQMAARGERFHG